MAAKPASKLLPKWFWVLAINLRSDQLPSMAPQVAVLLAEYADDYGRAWPARGTLAGLLGCTERTIGTALAGLRNDGAITRLVEHVGPGKRQMWQINWDHRKEFSRAGLNDDARRRVAKVMGHHWKEPASSQDETRCTRRKAPDGIRGKNFPTIPPTHPPQESSPRPLPSAAELKCDAHERLARALRAKNGLLESLLEDQNAMEIEAEAVDAEWRSPGSGIAVVMDRLNWSPEKAKL